MDPFVGFSSRSSLFLDETDLGDQKIIVTLKDKLCHLHAAKKASRTYRIFCIDVSYMYGHPYNEKTCFSG
ncbi:MAG: hypothetical protein AMK71_04960 [Nitrospira bacterium SG8_35_4]|nr:MAG: hypothetical protein AMK71_04960 [Nitrospira bacterium SG8_35_4]